MKISYEVLRWLVSDIAKKHNVRVNHIYTDRKTWVELCIHDRESLLEKVFPQVKKDILGQSCLMCNSIFINLRKIKNERILITAIDHEVRHLKGDPELDPENEIFEYWKMMLRRVRWK